MSKKGGTEVKKGLRISIFILTLMLTAVIIVFVFVLGRGWIAKQFDAPEFTPSDDILQTIERNKARYVRTLYEDIVRYTNIERGKRHIQPVALFDRAQHVAEYKVYEMANLRYFNHESPVYGDIVRQFEEFGGIVFKKNAYIVGENLALLEGKDIGDIRAKEVVDAWMDSEGHRENILNDEFEKIGVAVYVTDDRRCYIAQEFCSLIKYE